jgi:hypothetical protein
VQGHDKRAGEKGKRRLLAGQRRGLRRRTVRLLQLVLQPEQSAAGGVARLKQRRFRGAAVGFHAIRRPALLKSHVV